MEDDSPWIGKSISELELSARYRSGVIGIRQSNGTDFHYAPAPNYVIQPQEVLIVVTPMQYFDELRAIATGHTDKRPATLRLNVDLMSSGTWSRDVIRELISQHEGS